MSAINYKKLENLIEQNKIQYNRIELKIKKGEVKESKFQKAKK